MVYSEMQRVGIYLLVMLAASLLIYMCIRFIQSFSVERAEKGARSRLVSPSAVGVYRFIDKIRLRQLQTSIGILAAGLFVGTLLFCGVYNPLAVIVGGVVFFAAGFRAPWIYFSGKAKARAKEFEAGILDFAMGLTSALRSGQALPQALEAFSRRCEGPMKEELMIVIREYRLGLELSESLQRMYERVPCEDLQLLIVSIKLTTQ